MWRGTIYGPFLDILGNLWGSIRSYFEASLGPVQACLGASWGLCAGRYGASWSLLRASWGPLGASGGPLGAEGLDVRLASPLLGLLGAVFGRS